MRNSINWALAWVCVLGWLLVELLRLETTASVRTGEDRASHGLVGGSKFRRFGEEFVGFFAAPMTIRGRVVDQFGFSVVDANIEVIFSRVLAPDYGEVRELRKAELLGEFLVDGKNVEHVSIRATRDGYQWVDGMPGGESGSSATVSQFDVEGRGANGIREVVLRLHRLNPGRFDRPLSAADVCPEE